MQIEKEEKYILRLFRFSLVLKAFNALWEIALGLVILFDTDLKESLLSFTSRRIAGHPHDFVSRYIHGLLPHIGHSTELFIAFYFLAQGLVKIILIFGLLKKQLWAYPTAISVFFAFVFYQIYRFNHSHSPLLLVLSVLDIITILLIHHEYKILRGKIIVS